MIRRLVSTKRPTANGIYHWMNDWYLLQDGVWHRTEDDWSIGPCRWTPCGVHSKYPTPPERGLYTWFEDTSIPVEY